MSQKFKILLIDDEEAVIRSLTTLLWSQGYSHVDGISDSRLLEEYFEDGDADLVLLDMNMPYRKGDEVLQWIVSNRPEVAVIVVSAVNDVDTAVRCMKLGAVDYLVKPVDGTALLSSLSRALQLGALRRENEELRNKLVHPGLRNPEIFQKILTNSPKMLSIFEYIEVIANSNQVVMISGETGTGKEYTARAVHDASGRKGEFVAVNAAGLDDTMFSDSLFGHEVGAFTGASGKRPGLIERAANGTLFLDEIGDLSLQSQVKLLRLLQEKEYLPLGADRPKSSTARVVVATHCDLAKSIKEGKFRTDLFYRLRQHLIELPPLRDRGDDVALLFHFFLNQACQDLNIPQPVVDVGVMELLKHYPFPGNIRELQMLVVDAMGHLRGSTLHANDLNISTDFQPSDYCYDLIEEALGKSPELPAIAKVRELLMSEALRRSGGNQAIAANMLGLTRQAVSKFLREHPEV